MFAIVWTHDSRQRSASTDKLKKDFARDGELAAREANGKIFVLVVRGEDDQTVDGDQLAAVEPTIGEPEPSIAFSLNAKGGERMEKLTAAHLPSDDGFRRRLAIIFDGSAHSAPSIMARVGAKGVISEEDFRKLATAQSLTQSIVKSKSLSLLILFLTKR